MKWLSASVLSVSTLIVLIAHSTQAASMTNKPKLPPVTLANALSKSLAPTDGVVLTVGAERVVLPEHTVPPPAQATADAIAMAFGQATQTFGTVMAIAPATRVVLNTPSDPPEIASHLAPNVIFQMLLGSLDDTQWHALTSEQGLGLSDLTDETQKSLFWAQFPNQKLWVVSNDPALANQPNGQRADARDLSQRLEGVHIRLGQTAKIYLNDNQGKTIYFSSSAPRNPNGLSRWYPQREPVSKQYDVTLKSIVPNTSKPSDLHVDSPVFQTQIPCQGLHTVGALVARIAEQIHQELYADPHYAAQSLILIATTPSASASDLLQSLALSVAGTYRKVGPAFVLTDDLDGVGARRKRIAEWQQTAEAMEQHLHDLAGQNLLARRVQDACLLSGFGDPLALTPEQMQASLKSDPVSHIAFADNNQYPFSELTPEQQAQAQRIAADYETRRSSKTLPWYLVSHNSGAADLTKTVTFGPEYVVQLLIPFEPTPVKNSTNLPLAFMFLPGEAALAEGSTPPPLPKTSKKTLVSLLRSHPHRAIYGHPQTVAEVGALIAAMHQIGLNELYLDICPNGLAMTAENDAILNQALDIGPKVGIAVYADLNLTNWGDAPPEDACDRTITGETNRTAAIRQHTQDPDPHLSDYDDDQKLIPFKVPPMAVSFSSKLAYATLPKLVKDLSERQGLTGFVWEDAEVDSELGYTPDQRLAFLRAAHADPCDITPDTYSSIDLTLPTFDDRTIDVSLRGRWDRARASTHVALLRRMRQAISPLHAGLPILMPQGAGNSDWVASWDTINIVPPPLRDIPFENEFPKEAEVTAAAKTQGRTVSFVITRMRINPDALAVALKSMQTGSWDGYVLDYGPTETRGAHPLGALVQAISE